RHPLIVVQCSLPAAAPLFRRIVETTTAAFSIRPGILYANLRPHRRTASRDHRQNQSDCDPMEDARALRALPHPETGDSAKHRRSNAVLPGSARSDSSQAVVQGPYTLIPCPALQADTAND